MADTKETKITLFMGKQTLEYKEKLERIGEELLAEGIDVNDTRRGGMVSMAAVVRYLIDEEAKRRKIADS
jgi:hypothetical protein